MIEKIFLALVVLFFLELGNTNYNDMVSGGFSLFFGFGSSTKEVYNHYRGDLNSSNNTPANLPTRDKDD